MALEAFLFLCTVATPTLFGQTQAGFSHHAPSNSQLASPAIEKRVDALLKRMTLEEKLGQLVQYSDSGYDGQAQTAAEAAAAPGKNPATHDKVDAMELVSRGGWVDVEHCWTGADECIAARGGGKEQVAYSVDVWSGHHSRVQDGISDSAWSRGDI